MTFIDNDGQSSDTIRGTTDTEQYYIQGTRTTRKETGKSLIR